MGLVWVTGISGAGKSTVCRRMVELGYDAHDADEDGFREWRHKETGVPVGAPADWHDEQFTSVHAYRLRRDRVEELHAKARDMTVFLFGTVDNELEVWDLFDRVVCLVIEEATLRYRLATRTTSDFGKASHELEAVLGWHKAGRGGENYRGFGAVIVDGGMPVDEVAIAVLAAADEFGSPEGAGS
jgi:broad-specificity NMP kinase